MTLIGLITVLVGLYALASGPRGPVVVLILATLLGSAAALLIGSASIQPAHLMLSFVAIGIYIRKREAAQAFRALSVSQPGFWLAIAVAYGVIGGMFLPRILEGASQIIPVGSTGFDDTGSAVPLSPTSGNFTQAVYLVADLLCFVMVRAIASRAEGLAAIANAFVIFAAANIVFAALDFLTFQTGTAWTLDFIRNAQYTFHAEESASGLKRIVGSFLEASSFAHATLGALGFTGTMWLCGRRPALNGTLSVISLVLLALSTSSTGLVGTPAVLLLFYGTLVWRSLTGLGGRSAAAIVVTAPFAVLCIVVVISMSSAARSVLWDYADTLIFSKSTSQSGMERASWNALAWSNFVDSYGLGVGLGTSRASTLVLALLSNLGVPGSLAYAIFVWSSLRAGHSRADAESMDIRLGARYAAIGLLLADLISGALVDQGLTFYIMAAVASSELGQEPARARQRQGAGLLRSPGRLSTVHRGAHGDQSGRPRLASNTAPP